MKMTRQEIEAELAQAEALLPTLVRMLKDDGRAALRGVDHDELEVRLQHRNALRRMAFVRIDPATVEHETIKPQVAAAAVQIMDMADFQLYVDAFSVEADEPAGDWMVVVTIEHVSGASRTIRVQGSKEVCQRYKAFGELLEKALLAVQER